jgi:NADH-ubiquinone oxidoreductase chain 2
MRIQFSLLAKMISISILFILLSNAVTIRRDISILFNRIAIIVLIYCILQDLTSLSIITKGISLHGNLLHKTNITQIFSIFIYTLSILILQLISFYPKKLVLTKYTPKT